MEKSKRRPRGSGSIYLRGGSFVLFYRLNGRAKMVSLHCTNRKEAERKAKELLQPAMQLKSIESVVDHVAGARRLIRGKSSTIGRWTKDEEGNVRPAESWVAFAESPRKKDCGVGTLGTYASYWRAFTDWLAEHRQDVTSTQQIDADLAEEYMVALWKRDISARTYNAHLTGLAYIARVLQLGRTGTPFDGITRKDEARQERAGIPADKAWEILTVLANPETDIPNRAETRILWIIGLTTGFRLADAVLLQWKAIDVKKKIVHIIPAKTAARRPKSKRGKAPDASPPLHPLLNEALEEASGWKDESGYVLPRLAASFNKNRNAVDRNVIRVLDKVELKEVNDAERGIARRKHGFHSCRHFFCSECAKAGVPISKLAAMTGDRIETLQDYYVHDDGEKDEDVTAALAFTPEDREREEIVRGMASKLRSMPLDLLRKLASGEVATQIAERAEA